MNTRDAYNRIAEDWHKTHQEDDWWEEGVDEFVALLPAGARVLDIGCGAGTKTTYLEAKGVAVEGMDNSEGQVAIARRENPGVRFEVMGLEEIGGMERTFDGMFMQAVLLHVPRAEAQARVREIAGRLNPGGVFYIAVKELQPGSSLEEVKKGNEYGYEYERFFSYYTQAEIEAFLRDAGLVISYSTVCESNGTRWVQVIGRK